MKTALQIAMAELGIKEIKGQEHNSEILKYSRETALHAFEDDETPWCAAFVAWCHMKANKPYSTKPNARSWLNVGQSTSEPFPGDIAVFWRGSKQSWQGHVGFYLGHSNNSKKIHCLGGNQGDQVAITAYDANRLLGFRRIGDFVPLEIPKPLLRTGHRGKEVLRLQNLLSYLAFPCGPLDGDFGPKTAQGLKRFQEKYQLKVNGIYDAINEQKFEDLLKE